MTKAINLKKNGNGASELLVRFEFSSPTAKSVSVAGTFNDWRPGATPMVHLGNGHWVKQLVVPPGTYEYRLVVDGEWMADPLGSETVPNPFGGRNSVLKVSNGAATKSPRSAQQIARSLGLRLRQVQGNGSANQQNCREP